MGRALQADIKTSGKGPQSGMILCLRNRLNASGSGMGLKEEVVHNEMSSENGMGQILCSPTNHGRVRVLF